MRSKHYLVVLSPRIRYMIKNFTKIQIPYFYQFNKFKQTLKQTQIFNNRKTNESKANQLQVKDIEKSIARMLKRANGEKDLTVKRDG